MNFAFLRSALFWRATLLALLCAGGFFAWEMNLLSPIGITGPMRPPVSTRELTLTVLIVILFSLNVGLFVWQKKQGSCPRGTRRAMGIAGAIGAIALICPACAVGSIGFIGLASTLVILAPFFPLFQIIAVILLGGSLILLLPRK